MNETIYMGVPGRIVGTTQYSKYDFSLQDTFGVKANAGFNITEDFSIFASVGLSYYAYEAEHNAEVTNDSSGLLVAKGKFLVEEETIAPVVGLGFSYKFAKKFETALSYEFSKFEIEDKKIVGKDVEFAIDTIKLSLNYLF